LGGAQPSDTGFDACGNSVVVFGFERSNAMTRVAEAVGLGLAPTLLGFARPSDLSIFL